MGKVPLFFLIDHIKDLHAFRRKKISQNGSQTGPKCSYSIARRKKAFHGWSNKLDLVARDTAGRLLQRTTQTRDTHTEVLSEPPPLKPWAGALQERYCLMGENKVTLTAEQFTRLAENLETVTARLANLGNCIPEAIAEGYWETDMKRVKLPIPQQYGGGQATGATLEDAVKNLIERVLKNTGYTERRKTPLFSECFEKWITIKEGAEKSENTIAGYRGIAKTHLLPFFDGKQIGDITPDDIQIYFNSIRKLSKSMSQQSMAILKGVFERAQRNEIISKNPMQYKYDVSRKEGKRVVLQDNDFIDAINNLESLKEPFIKDYFYACILFFTGLRRGEILGLKWKDINFDEMTITVSRQVIYPNGQSNPIVRPPKDDSKGVVSLLSVLSERIKEYAGKPEDYIIAYSKEEPERPITRSIFDKMMKRINKKIDLKGATSHSFRHTYPTMINAHCANVDQKVLQDALRHKTPDLAMKIYTEKNESKTRRVEQEYDNYLRSVIGQNTGHSERRETA